MASIELFAGAGGLGMGLTKAGFHHMVVIEWDRDACATIAENRKRGSILVRDWPVIRADVKQFSFRKFSGRVDIVSGGPPCQPFSVGGKHRGHLDDRDMFPQAIRAIREIAPKAFIFENVKGLTRVTFANYVEYIKLQLKFPELTEKPNEEWFEHRARLERLAMRGKYDGLEYNVIVQVLNAANFGVPQKRERFFIAGFRSDLGVKWHFPPPTHSRWTLLWDQWVSGKYWERHQVAKNDRPKPPEDHLKVLDLFRRPPQKPWLTVRDAISDLPDPERNPSEANAIPNHVFQPGARQYVGHTGSPLDEPAKTLKAGDHGVPGGENMLRRPDGSVRYFTVRESARLQTFPDDYVFSGSWTENMRQLGNAVPVRLAETIAISIRNHLHQESSEGASHPLPFRTADGNHA